MKTKPTKSVFDLHKDRLRLLSRLPAHCSKLPLERIQRLIERRDNPRLQIISHPGRNAARFQPSRIRRSILAMLTPDQWTGFIHIAGTLRDDLGQNADMVSSVIDFLEEKGRLIKTELYSGTKNPDKTMHPGFGKGQYHGFQWGYKPNPSFPRPPASAGKTGAIRQAAPPFESCSSIAGAVDVTTQAAAGNNPSGIISNP